MLKLFAPQSNLHWSCLVLTTAAIICALTVTLVFALIPNPSGLVFEAIIIAFVISCPFLGFFYFVLGRLAVVTERMRTMAETDQLTGLPNRRDFYRTASAVERKGDQYLVIILDIDHFKRINDTHGHMVGDECLQKVAEYLRRFMRPDDRVCRYGGEEFAVILKNQPVDIALGMARNVALGRDFAVSIGTLTVTFSMGIAQWEQGLSFDEVLRRADIALYAAKSNGRARADVFQQQPGLEEAIAQAS